jgi:glycosyltransferase involved in cell wall biosynthesis
MKENQLTIVIPTYNRKERLLNQLDHLFKQDVSKSIKIIIVDNHSNYDVKYAVRKKYSKIVFSNIEIIVRPFNIGLGAAITMPFLLCKTDWLWVLGDDDEVKGDLNRVLNDLKLYNDYAYLKYNISNSSPQENKDIATIDDFLSYFGSKKHSTGDLVFISNSLFNLSLLKQYLGLAIMWSNTLIGHLIPVIFGLCESKIKCRMID